MGTTSNFANAWHHPNTASDIVDDIFKMVKAMPPVETWCSTRRAPIDQVLRVTGSGENFIVAHPDVWHAAMKDGHQLSPTAPIALFGGMISDIAVTDIDDDAREPKDGRERRASVWFRIMETIVGHGGEIPEWMTRPDPDPTPKRA